jgi:hypothetical protein
MVAGYRDGILERQFCSRSFWAETRAFSDKVSVWFSTIIFPFYKMLFMNRLEFSLNPQEGTVNSMEQKTRVFCSIDVQEFHLGTLTNVCTFWMLYSNQWLQAEDQHNSKINIHSRICYETELWIQWLTIHKHEIIGNFLPKSKPCRPLGITRKKFRLFSFDFCQYFGFRQFSLWRGTTFLLRVIFKKFCKCSFWSH